MKFPLFFLLLFVVVVDGFAQKNENSQAYSNVHHFGSNISIKNFDGTNSSVLVNGNSATLFNADGTQSTIEFSGDLFTLIAADGTSSSVNHNNFSSTIFNSDGSRLFVNHMQGTSSCSTPNGKHRITHTFGKVREMCYKNVIDVLIHRNWVLQTNKLAMSAESISEEDK